MDRNALIAAAIGVVGGGATGLLSAGVTIGDLRSRVTTLETSVDAIKPEVAATSQELRGNVSELLARLTNVEQGFDIIIPMVLETRQRLEREIGRNEFQRGNREPR